MIEPTVAWPKSLPPYLRTDDGFTPKSTFDSTEMASGRSRSRPKFGSVPTSRPVTWWMTSAQARAFEAWFRDSIANGAAYFLMPFHTPLGGWQPFACKFADKDAPYVGPKYVANDTWQYTARLELWERPMLPAGWGKVPDYVACADIIDRVVNQKWPQA